MTTQRPRAETEHLRRGRRRAVAMGVAMAVAALLRGPAFPQSPDAGSSPAYEVTSVKPAKPGEPARIVVTDDLFAATNATLWDLIEQAYGLYGRSQVSGLPKWAYSVHFDVTGKIDAATVEAFRKLPYSAQWPVRTLMDQALLRDRFALTVRHQTAILPVYALEVARGGPKLRRYQEGEDQKPFYRRDGYNFSDATMKRLAQVLSRNPDVGRIVLDETGLSGRYDFVLTWTPFSQQGPAGAGQQGSANAAGLSIFAALQNELGLKLTPTKGPVDTLVIEHVQRPTPD